jgi:hypothetical protein
MMQMGPLARISVTSSRPVSFSLTLDNSIEPLLIIDEFGIVSPTAALVRVQNPFTLRGRVMVTDDRTSCNLASGRIDGPCVATANFTLHIVGLFACPSDILVQSATPTTASWTLPVLTAPGFPIILSKSSGSIFSVGGTCVELSIMNPDASQLTSSLGLCSFWVSFMVLCQFPLIHTGYYCDHGGRHQRCGAFVSQFFEAYFARLSA